MYYIYLYISISVLNSIRSWYTDLPSSPNDLSTTSTSPLSAPNKSITCEESLFVRCPGQPKRVRSQRHAEIQIAGVAGAETFLLYIWVWVNTYRYIFSGMNIHKSQLLWGSRMVPGFWPIPIYIYMRGDGVLGSYLDSHLGSYLHLIEQKPPQTTLSLK